MKYAVIKVVNGNYFIHAEGFTDVNKAKVSYHGICQALWNADEAVKADVRIVDENLDTVEEYKEFIQHDAKPQEQGE